MWIAWESAWIAPLVWLPGIPGSPLQRDAMMKRPSNSIVQMLPSLLFAWIALATVADTVLTAMGTIQPLNDSLTRAIYQLERPWLDLLMIVCTYLGTDPVLFVVAIATAVWATRRGAKRDGLLLIGVAVTARVIGILAKYAVEKPRPHIQAPPAPLVPLYGYGYPSGHALMAMSILGFSAIVVARLVDRPWVRWVVVTACALLVFAIGLSRVYLGLHWVNDVIGGYLYGALIVLVAYMVQPYSGRRRGENHGSGVEAVVGRPGRPLGKG